MDRFKAFWLAPLVLIAFAVSHGSAHGAAAAPTEAEPGGPPAQAPAGETEGASERPPDEGDGLPGRDDPEEFYKKPPRKPKLRTSMYA